ncbi:hypothetical protein CW368_11905 [Actinomycetales bacterium SN12]|nr:hypothetical protein CW368_11905 [Actinomycetales bacterium SN12]
MTGNLRVGNADLQRRPSRLVVWMQRHPVLVDIAVVLAAGAPQLVAMIARDGEGGWWGYLLLAVTAAALMVRRRWPFTVLVVVAVACAASPLAQPGFGYPLIPFSFALYTVASRQPTSRALIGYGVSVAATVLATIPYSVTGATPPLVSLLDPFSLLALVIGIIVKNRREHREWLTEFVNERIQNAALTERTRIAAEMHDVVAHALTMIVTLANGAQSIREKSPEKADAAVAQIASTGRDALNDIHRTLGLLRSADAGLDANLHHSGSNLPTLDELVENFRSAGLSVTLNRSGLPVPDDIALRQTIYRIVQESLTNTLRHAADPCHANVELRHEEGEIIITVDDDGRPRTEQITLGHGLIGIQQRAAAHGGHAHSSPRVGGGWRTHVVLPTAPHTETDD